MSTPAPPPASGSTDRRAVLGAVVVVLLLLAAWGAFALGRGTADPAAAPGPGGSGLPAPGPTVTVTGAPVPVPTPTPALPSTGGDTTGDGTTSGTGGGDAAAGAGASDGAGAGDVTGSGARAFTMSASLGGAPVLIGQQRDLTVTVRNPNSSALELSSVRATPRAPSINGCLASWVSVSSYDASRDGSVRVPAGGSATVTLTFELVNLASTNQNACQGATFPLSLSGSGRVV